MKVMGHTISDELVARAIETVEARDDPFTAHDVRVELSHMLGIQTADKPVHWLSEVVNRGLQQARKGGVLRYEGGRWVPNLGQPPPPRDTGDG